MPGNRRAAFLQQIIIDLLTAISYTIYRPNNQISYICGIRRKSDYTNKKIEQRCRDAVPGVWDVEAER